MEVNLVLQPTPETCGQACIAIITGKSVEDVIRDMKTCGPASIDQLIDALDRYGVRHTERNTRISKKNPTPHSCSILTIHTNAGYTHWVLLHDRKYYDPEFGVIEDEYPMEESPLS